MPPPVSAGSRSAEDNVAGWIDRHAEERPDSLAVADARLRLDYAAFGDRVRRCAGWFAGEGVGPGDRVALLLRNRSAYLETVFAAARLGAIAVPLNARLTAAELHGLLADCRPAALLTDAEHETAASAACKSLAEPPWLRTSCDDEAGGYEAAIAAAAPREAIEPVSPEDPMILMYTSGTTGTPKGALLPHRKSLYNARNAEIFFGLSSGDRVLIVLPLFHSFGLKILALPMLHAGGGLILQERFDPDAVWKTVDFEDVTFFGGVPTMFRALLDRLDEAPEGHYVHEHLRFLFTAGAAIPVETIRGFERHGLVLKQGFGQTETSILCCLDAEDALRKAGSVGRPVFHAELRVIRSETLERRPELWEDVDTGEPGEIVVRGPITMIGYWENPEATAETLRDGWLRTGDLATIDDEGFLTLVGRARDMYISGGENVYPAEVEAVYEQHPAIREIAVTGVADARWGEVGHAWCVPEAGATIDEEALVAWGAERLADFKLPRRFYSVAELPRTASGKVQKHRLERPAAAR
jgi:fatty-acyl-CoA synthase